MAATGANEIWVTHGQEDALVHWCGTRGLKARPLDIVGYGDEDEEGLSSGVADGQDGKTTSPEGAADAAQSDAAQSAPNGHGDPI